MTAILPPGWPRPKGYANGVAAAGRQIHVAGMIGWDARQVFHSDDIVDQVRQALQNIVAVLEAADARAQHIVRMTWYVTDKKEYLEASPGIGRVFREVIGHYDIAMTAVEVKALKIVPRSRSRSRPCCPDSARLYCRHQYCKVLLDSRCASVSGEAQRSDRIPSALQRCNRRS